MERSAVKAIREAIDNHDFSEIERTLGVKIALGNASFDPSAHGSATFKLTVTPVVNGTTKNAEQIEFERYAHLYNLTPNDFGAVFSNLGTEYRISGLKMSRHKFPISATRVSDGRAFKFPSSTVLAAMRKK